MVCPHAPIYLLSHQPTNQSFSSNMLYPKEDPESHKLQFACRTCQYAEDAASSCVFRNVLNNQQGETAGVTQDVGSDPTLPRSNKECPMCHNEDAVFFQSQQRSAETGMVCISEMRTWLELVY